MQRPALTLIAAILLASSTSSLLAQSGSRGLIPIVSSVERTAGNHVESSNFQSEISRLQSEANTLQSMAQSGYRDAQMLLEDTQSAIETLKMNRRQQREQAVTELREKNIRRHQELEIENAMRLAKSTIAWPSSLQKKRYDKHCAEIEALAKLYAQQGDRACVKIGFNTAVRNFAKQIVRDEQAGAFDESQSREVRAFVRAVNKNYGQFPGPMKQKMSKEMLVSNM